MGERGIGLLSLYNLFHDPTEKSSDILHLRNSHIGLDCAVSAAYGWPEKDLEYAFIAIKDAVRFTLAESQRKVVLDRLLELNHQRHAEEVAAGLVDENGKPLKAKGGKGGRGKGKANAAQPALALG
jgi:hypothetical protein